MLEGRKLLAAQLVRDRPIGHSSDDAAPSMLEAKKLLAAQLEVGKSLAAQLEAGKLLAAAQPVRDRPIGLSFDDAARDKQIQATHSPSTEDYDVRPLLSIVEDILRLSRPLTDYIKDNPPSYPDAKIDEMLGYAITKVSCEMTCKCAGGGDLHNATMYLLKSLSKYSWDAKAVIAFAGFCIIYGDFWLVQQHYTENPFAKKIATLKNLSKTMAQSGDHFSKLLEVVRDLLIAVLKVTHCIIELKELPPMYISAQSPEVMAATAHVPMAVYWILRSFLFCTSTLLNLIGGSHEYSTSVAWEMASFAHKLSCILDHFQGQLRNCREIVEKKKAGDAYIKFKRLLESAHIDNMKVLNAFFRPRDDQKPLYHGSRRTNDRLDVLRLKYVLLLITDLELPPEELLALHMIHNDPSMRRDCEIVWIPVVDSTTSMTSWQDTAFSELRNHMPWYSAEHPSAIEQIAVKYIREVLRFTHMPMLAVFDPCGALCHHDALPIIWIWGSKAFPFTREKAIRLWDETNEWNIDLILDGVDPRTPEWIKTEKVICLYGGVDINWIRRFTMSARKIAMFLQVPLEMLYVGKSNPTENVRRCHYVIGMEMLSHISATDFHDFFCYFWMRIASMWNSKKQIGRRVEDDNIMPRILDLLTYDSSEQGWAVFSRGNNEIAMANGDKVVPVLESYDTWVYEVDHPDKFVPVLDKQIRGYHLEHHCHRVTLPTKEGQVLERLVCSECGKTMDKFFMYRCCTD